MAQLVKAGVKLRDQINKKWPNRDKLSDGWIGDSSHAARPSDHNPDSRGWVHAIDVDKDLRGAAGDADWLADSLVKYCREKRAGSERIKNIVYKGRVASGTYPDKFWVWRAGDYGHYSHIHISFTGKAEWDDRWFAISPFVTKGETVTVVETYAYAAPSRTAKRIVKRAPGFKVTYVRIKRVNGETWLGTVWGRWYLAKRTKRGD